MQSVPASRPLWQRVDAAGQSVQVGTGRLKLLAHEMDEALKADKFASPQTKRLVTRLRALAGNVDEGVNYVPLKEFRQNMTSLGAELGQPARRADRLPHSGSTACSTATQAAMIKAMWPTSGHMLGSSANGGGHRCTAAPMRALAASSSACWASGGM